MERCAYCGKYHEDWESYSSISTFMSELHWCSKACTLNDPDFLRLEKEQEEREERAKRAQHSAMNSESNKYREEVAKFSSMEEWYRFKLAEQKARSFDWGLIVFGLLLTLPSGGVIYWGYFNLDILIFCLLVLFPLVVFGMGLMVLLSAVTSNYDKSILVFRGEGLAVVEHFGLETFKKYKAEGKVTWMDHKGAND